MYAKLGQMHSANALAGHLPHRRESREEIRAILHSKPTPETLDAYLRYLVLGE